MKGRTPVSEFGYFVAQGVQSTPDVGGPHCGHVLIGPLYAGTMFALVTVTIGSPS